jgi:DNA-directed RNA polymerase subunit RPC12/RpoP
VSREVVTEYLCTRCHEKIRLPSEPGYPLLADECKACGNVGFVRGLTGEELVELHRLLERERGKTE